jgi:hypothetical protein
MTPPATQSGVSDESGPAPSGTISGQTGGVSERSPAPEAPYLANSSLAAGRRARVLIALYLSLVGFFGVAFLIYATKYLGAGPTVFDLPTRDLWVGSLMLVVSPLVLAVFQRVSIAFLLPSIALIFLLYPLFSPFGLPYDRDVVYNFQFASVLLQSGHWAPGVGVTGQAYTYSFYPGSGVYDAEFASVTGVPVITTIQWSIPILRLLILPPAIYGLGKRLFGSRVGMLGLILAMGTPSVLFNLSVQQEFAIPFLALAFLLLAFIVLDPAIPPSGIVIAFVLCSAFIVVSHHLTSYVLLAWLGGFLLVAALVARKGPMRWKRAAPLFVAYSAFFVLYTYFVSLPSFLEQVAQIKPAFAGFVAATPGAVTPGGAGIGQSFPLYQQAWIYGAFLLIIVISILGLRAYGRSRGWDYASVNVVLALVVTIASIPFLATEFSFLVLRVMEWTGLFLLPVVAWWLLQRVWPRLSGARTEPSPPTRAPGVRWRAYAGPLVTLAVVVLIFTGGSLAPYTSRDQFAPTSQIQNDSPVLVNQNDYDLGLWAHAHLNPSSLIWGDYYTFSILGGFGRFNVSWDSYLPFNGTSVSEAAWALLKVGQYIVVDQYMTTKTPSFYGPGTDQPTGPLSVGQVTKFNDPTYFDCVFNDSSFTIYLVIQLI